MRYLSVVILCVCLASAQRNEVSVVSSNDDVQSYNQPAQALCMPGQFGLMCGAHGESTGYVHFISVKAKIGGDPVLLTCAIRKVKDSKHCSRLMGDRTYPAEPKGNDKVIVYAWHNPMYHGDMSKAEKLEFHISPRALDAEEKSR